MAADLPAGTRTVPSWSTSTLSSPKFNHAGHDRADSASDTFFDDKLTLPSTVMEVKEIQSSAMDKKTELVIDDRYLSSEEELSPCLSNAGSEIDDDDVFVEEPFEIMEAVKITARPYRGRTPSPSRAVRISIVSAGKPSVVEIPSVQQSHSDHLPQTEFPTLPRPVSRRLSSLPNMHPAPPVRPAPQRPTRIVTSGLDISKRRTTMSPHTMSPRHTPLSVLATPSELYRAHSRSSVYSTAALTNGAQTPDFLTSDPFASSPAAKGPPLSPAKLNPRNRLRTFSKSITIARLMSGKKEKEARPPMPDRKDSTQSIKSIRSSSLMVPNSPSMESLSTHSTLSPTSPLTPSDPIRLSPNTRKSRLIPRAANERAKPIELPPFPDEGMDGSDEASTEDLRSLFAKERKLRKRDTLQDMDLATFLASDMLSP